MCHGVHLAAIFGFRHTRVAKVNNFLTFEPCDMDTHTYEHMLLNH